MELIFELEDDLWWQTEACIPTWNAFKRTGQLTIDNDNMGFDTQIIFAPEGRDSSELNSEEIDSVEFVVENEKEIVTSLLDGLLREYPKMQEQYGYSEEEKEQYMPNVASVSDFRRLIDLNSIYVHPLLNAGAPYAGFLFSCEWDQEHGLGVLMHGSRVVEIGGADAAILSWIAENDAKTQP